VTAACFKLTVRHHVNCHLHASVCCVLSAMCCLGMLWHAVSCCAVLCQATTRIKYVTDGLLLREMMDDPLLTKYRCALVKGRGAVGGGEEEGRSTMLRVMCWCWWEGGGRRPQIDYGFLFSG
jgi:hypothetical protein